MKLGEFQINMVSSVGISNIWPLRNCPRCKVPRKASKRLSISRLPPILIVHLKRFSFKGPFSDKIDTAVHFPLYGFDLETYIPTTTAPRTSGKSMSDLYDLYAVSQHFGTLSSGHCMYHTILVFLLLNLT